MRVAGGLDREQQRLGAAGGHVADDPGRRVDAAGDLRGGGDQVVLHRQQAGERGRIQPVDVRGERVRGGGQLVQAGHRRVVHIREQPAAVGGQVTPAQRAQLRQHLLGRYAVGR
ncbi:hypothetical protein Athai_45030 [Actinocatenispora thailandica]|uniref:Uncharacterized protein n=1 Tax=Actinocatenispora thailandica TaxID=227318 RepID=A0A7R7DSF0_9ACTN|nr:hypothetical protein Athai_45030 [Actinocatenispora thailandica]